MEVISTNNNNNHNVNNNTWGSQYHRYSSLSLASAANSEDNYSLADQSFYTCCDGGGEDLPEQISTSILLTTTGRVASYSCLEDVQEEKEDPYMDDHMSWASQPTMPTVVPLKSYSQLQQCGGGGAGSSSSTPLTAARLALSSDIGMLRRSMDSDFNNTNVMNNASKAAKMLLERDQRMTSSALPMSRSFATPRSTVNTAYRLSSTTTTTTTCSSVNSFTSARDNMNMMDTDLLMPPIFLTVESKYQRRSSVANKPFKLEELADDVQLMVLSFLTLEDVRGLMATNQRYRKLLFTRDAQNLWSHWCSSHQWMALTHKIVVDDLSLPTAARPCSLTADWSSWHQQANLSLLLSMAQSQPTEIDVVQLNEYHTHQQANTRSRRRRSRHRVHTTDGSQPLLKYYKQEQQDAQPSVVQFTGRVGQGDRCVRANKPFPRPTLIHKGEWLVPPSRSNSSSSSSKSRYSLTGGSSGSGKHHGLLDLFCRSARAVPPPRPAWRPFVAPFLSDKDESVVHLTPRFVSYYEVSILEPTHHGEELPSSSATDCVAVGVATESFDWHTRMPGWDASSFGYHGDDGGIFHSSGGMLRKFGPSYGRGDVVGCGIDHVMRGIFFTLNGEFLGYGWTGLPQEILERELYPVVGIDTNDFIHCNFGNEPFQYDLKSLVVKHEELVHQSLSLASPLAHSVRSV